MQVEERTLMLTCKLAALAGFVLECYRKGEMVKKGDELLGMFKEMLEDMTEDDHHKVVLFIAECVKDSGQHAEGSDEAVTLDSILERLSNGDAS